MGLVSRCGEHERSLTSGIACVEVVAALNMNSDGPFNACYDGHLKELTKGSALVDDHVRSTSALTPNAKMTILGRRMNFITSEIA